MNLEANDCFRQGNALPLLQSFSTHYLMLKPDGNTKEIRQYVRQVFRQNLIHELLSFQVLFDRESAYAFYPKSPLWKEKYGQKRIETLTQAGLWKDTDSLSALSVGEVICSEMATYLSEGPCRVYLFQTFGAADFCRRLVGETDPSQASPQSLRGMFSKDSLKQAATQTRALRNVAHAPDSNSVEEELLFLSRVPGVAPDDKTVFTTLLRPIFPNKAHLFGV